MQIILKSMSLVNFKGIRSQKFQFSPHLNIISGDNASGKTTILDGFLWCLFGKDSADRKDFEVKTLDSSGNVIERLDHEVEIILEVDFKEVTLKRVLSEKWTKKRGSDEAEFTGNETTYFWNEVPLKQAEYNAKISNLVDEGLFKLLTNVSYFHGLHWEKRRDIIFSLAGPISDSDILDGTATLLNKEHTAIISNILNAGKTLAEAKAETASKKKRIKDELQFIPSRIDEAERSKPEPVDTKAIEAEKKAIEAEITTKQAALNKAIKSETDYSERLNQANKAYNERLDQLYKLKAEHSQLSKKIEADVRSNYADNTLKIDSLTKEINECQNNLTRLNERIINGTNNLQELEVKITSRREDWAIINAETMPEFDSNSCACPTCKQALPEDEIRLKKDQFTANFNQNKTERLASIQQTGKELAGQKTDIESLLADLKSDVEKHNSKIAELTKELQATAPVSVEIIKQEIASKLEEANDLSVIQARIQALEESMSDKPKDDTGNELFVRRQALQTDINVLNRQLNELSAKSGNQEQVNVIDNRINELKNQETKLAGELNQLEKVDYSILLFEKQRVAFIEKIINDKFGFVTFKMFETQINGSEIPCCKTLINGVPFEDANTAGKINAGLDIINALSNYHNIKAPIFIDNAESINRFIETDCQLIRLQVTKDKALVFKSELQQSQ